MSQVIVYQNPDGTNVCVCHPTGELPIDEVLVKDCPAGAIIIDNTELPQGADNQFFDAWELVDGKVVVNFDKAKAIKLSQYNSYAIQVARKRQANTMVEITNIPDDAIWLANLTADRNAIASATTTDELIAVPNPVDR